MDELPRVLTRSAARARGLSADQIDRRLARGRWSALLPGVYLTADSFTWLDRVRAGLLCGGPDALLTGAAALYVSDIKIARPPTITVLVPRDVKRRCTEWLQIRRTAFLPAPMPAPMPWPGPRRAPVARAVVDHALTCRRLDDVRTVVARAVRTNWCTVADIHDELAHAQCNGSALLRTALTDIGASASASASAPEARAARILRRNGIDGFVQNARVDYPGGFYVADFLWPELRAVLEIDSVEYHLDPVDWRATMDRHLRLETLGYSVVHRPPSALADPSRFAGDIRQWLASRPVS